MPDLDEIGFGSYEGGALADYRSWAWSTSPMPCARAAVRAGSTGRSHRRALAELLGRRGGDDPRRHPRPPGEVHPRRVRRELSGGADRARPHATPFALEADAAELAAETLLVWATRRGSSTPPAEAPVDEIPRTAHPFGRCPGPARRNSVAPPTPRAAGAARNERVRIEGDAHEAQGAVDRRRGGLRRRDPRGARRRDRRLTGTAAPRGARHTSQRGRARPRGGACPGERPDRARRRGDVPRLRGRGLDVPLARPPGARLRVDAVHVHHGLRGAKADADATHCAAAPARRASMHARRRQRRSLRELRYALTAGTALRATGHTASDQVETVLYRHRVERLERGIRARREDGVVRPLLPLWREEREAYCRERGLSWRSTRERRDQARVDPRADPPAPRGAGSRAHERTCWRSVTERAAAPATARGVAGRAPLVAGRHALGRPR